MTPSIIIPFRESTAKSRLPERGRAELARAMFEDVCTACEEVGETILATAQVGLGAAVSAALARVSARPVLIVNADLPAATSQDLRLLLRAIPPHGLALVEAEDGTTNALGLSSPALFSPVYGPGSASRFRRLARSRTVMLPNLVQDVDTLDDLRRLDRVGARTRAALHSLGFHDECLKVEVLGEIS